MTIRIYGKSLLALAALWTGTASAQSLFSPLNEVCPQALDARNYQPDEVLHLIKGQGKDGWIFGAREFENYQPVIDMLPELRAFQAALRRRGTELALVLLPPRGVAERRYIDPAKPVFSDINLDALAASYHEAVAQLNAQGITTPDLLALQQQRGGADFFFPRDHHWNTAAMQAAGDELARQLADTLRQVPTTGYRLSTFNQVLVGTY